MTASYRIFKNLFGIYTVEFLVGKAHNTDLRNTNGTGVNSYDTEGKAKAAGRRYLRKMKKMGFEV